VPHHYFLIAATTKTHIGPHLHTLRHHALRHSDRLESGNHKRKSVAHIHLPILSHIRVHGPALGYVGLFLFAILSGIGVNGFGEAALIAAAVYVANHHLSVTPVVSIAAAGGFVGGALGFLIGRFGGRSIVMASGPFFHFRRKMFERSQEVYLHYDAFAILITPAWAAGIHRVRWLKFLWLNVVSALLWAASLGLAAYYLGSRITTEFSNEIGWILGGVAAVLVIYYVLQRALRTPSGPSR
jgi:membrane protein DedA with SNARE-associated domain